MSAQEIAVIRSYWVGAGTISEQEISALLDDHDALTAEISRLRAIERMTARPYTLRWLDGELRRLQAIETDYEAVGERNKELHEMYFVLVRDVERLQAIEAAAREVVAMANLRGSRSVDDAIDDLETALAASGEGA